MEPLQQTEGDVNISPKRTKWQEKHIDAEARVLLKEDARYFLKQSLSTPCLNALRGCDGIYIEDLQGRRFMDFHGNNVHQVGFANPVVISAIKKQLDELSFCTRRYTNRVAVDLAKKLAQLAPGDLNKILFCPGGTGAIGIAMKLVRLATGRHKTISMWDSFHGASLDAVSIGGEAVFRQNIGPLLPGTEHAPPPDEYRCIFGCDKRGGCDLSCAKYVEYILEKEGDIAAVISEPIRSTPYIPKPEYWQTIRRACDRHGALLIFDEIPHALGRTGKMFTFENFEVIPDIVVIGKGLGGGIIPLAAVIAREDLDIAGHQALGHYTHEKNPVACAAALAAIEYIEKQNLVEHARELGEYTLKRLIDFKNRHPMIGDVRGIGLFLGIELVKDRIGRERACDEAESVMYAALSKGLSFKLTMGNILTLTPALTITKDEMDEALGIIDACITEVEQNR
ncbi:MAG: aspartate aminotransferase family protein [Desulfobacterales bacterium]|jgi:4-aminobutyrate aminotransferase|nr:aspartate aminotransferase family protein [Desulfobacter sp.]MDP6395130.1 aspartate aminotransferase family protein [Desulfobacterales bacterium]MDP6683183.1 aspartate aminotransferase family protein [Desulfobacterales bacterium]MDP6806396.1 aspartate aminotransferase family protein [Desulfobacterales bacterium]|tara:strand:+ start:22929 stop:24287 length:1359 start_codon:yes stop_codon:yes gene_type:complete